jgi:group I intron endonuclease
MNNIKNQTNINIVAVSTYINMAESKEKIYKENRGKSGIYRIYNIKTGKCYIGSSKDLTRRLGNYYCGSFLMKELKNNRSKISNTLLKHDYHNFNLDILEYCELDKLILREQYYIDILCPEYNILKTAGSTFGHKHSPETILKYKARTHSEETKNLMSKAKIGKPLSAYCISRRLLAISHVTTVLNKENNSIKIYDSLRAAAIDLNTSHTVLSYYIKNNKLYKNIYLITKKKNSI